jgi:hypothetical protein
MTPPTTAISIDLLDYLQGLYWLALKEFVFGDSYSGEINGSTNHAIPAYIIAVTAVESFVNEMFFGPIGQSFKSLQSQGFWDALEKASLSDKLLFAPEFYFGETFATNAQPYQDMMLLIRLRNSLVHYRMNFDVPKSVKDLKQRNIALRNSNISWTSCISTTEGMRWAHKTVCETIGEIIEFDNSEEHNILTEYGIFCAGLLKPIEESGARKFVNKLSRHKKQHAG